MKKTLTILFTLAMATLVEAIDFRTEVAINKLGLRLPIMTDAKSVPLPPLQVYTYTLTLGEEQWQEERYDPWQLWYATQHVAEWADAAGNRMILGMVTMAPPSSFTDAHVTRRAYQEFADLSTISGTAVLTQEGIQHWMAEFFKVGVGIPQRLTVNSQRLDEVFAFPTESVSETLYVFRLKRSGNEKIPDVWLAAGVFINEQEVDKARKIVQSDLVGKIAPLGRFDMGGQEAAASPFRQHPTRAAAHRSVAGLPDWLAIDSEDYVVLTNNKTAERFVKDLLEDAQVLRAFYLQRLPGFADTIDDVAIIRIFADGKDYDSYVGADYAWSSGIFSPMRRELVIRPTEGRMRGAQKYDSLLRIVAHEAWHQYLFQAVGGIPVSLWLNEGMATFLEAVEFRLGKAKITESAGRAEIVTAMAKKGVIDLRPLLLMTPAEFYGGTDAERSAKYALAWALMYYIERGAPLERNKPYEGILARYMAALQATRNADQATVAAFDGIDIDKFSRSFTDFWKNDRARRQAERN